MDGNLPGPQAPSTGIDQKETNEGEERELQGNMDKQNDASWAAAGNKSDAGTMKIKDVEAEEELVYEPANSYQAEGEGGEQTLKNVKGSQVLLYEAMISRLKRDGFNQAALELEKATGLQVTNTKAAEFLSIFSQFSKQDNAAQRMQPIKFKPFVIHDSKNTLNYDLGPSVKTEEEIVDPHIPREAVLQLAPPVPRVTLRFKKACLTVATSQNSKLLAAGSADGTIKVAEVPPRGHAVGEQDGENENIMSFSPSHAPVMSLSFHPRKAIIFSGCSDGCTKIAECKNKVSSGAKILAALQDAYPVRCVTPHPCGDFLYIGARHPVLRVYDLQTLQCYTSAVDHSSCVSPIVSLDVSKDGSLAATGCENGMINIYDSVTGQVVSTMQDGDGMFPVSSLSWSKAPWYIMGAGLSGAVSVWDLRKGQKVITFGNSNPVYTHNRAIFLHDEEYVALCSIGGHLPTDRDISIYSAYTGQWIMTFGGLHPQPVCHMVSTPNQLGLICGSVDGWARWLDFSQIPILERMQEY